MITLISGLFQYKVIVLWDGAPKTRLKFSYDRISHKTGGGVMTLTLDARNSKRSFEAAMGFGGNRLILDESSLIGKNII